MIQSLIGKKTEQTQKFLENGKRIPVTKVVVAGNTVLQLKTQTTDGYTAVQLGFGAKRKVVNALAGHVKKSGSKTFPATIKEVAPLDKDTLPALGDIIALDSVFKPGDIVSVTGTSKGKGFAGVVKRHGFRGGPKTHGQSDRERAPGSIGQSTTPGRVYKGKRMAGRMGSDTVTVANLSIVGVDSANNMLLIAGLVPGPTKGYLLVTKTGEMKQFVPLLQANVPQEEAQPEQEAPQSVSDEVVAESATVAEEKDEAVKEEEKKEEGGKEDAK